MFVGVGGLGRLSVLFGLGGSGSAREEAITKPELKAGGVALSEEEELVGFVGALKAEVVDLEAEPMGLEEEEEEEVVRLAFEVKEERGKGRVDLGFGMTEELGGLAAGGGFKDGGFAARSSPRSRRAS